VALIPADFRTRFEGQFDLVPDARIEFWLEDAQLEVGAQAWGALYEKGVMLLAAHLLQLELDRQEDDESGSITSNRVTSRSVGDVSVSFARATADNSDEDWYLLTDYGAEYLRLKRRMGMGAVAVGGF
jgi:hypothetical protein